jgi:hypothetical protein
MRDESGQQPPALTTRRIALGNGEPIVNPDSWRKIRKTTANIYLGSMLSYSRLVYLSALPWCPRAPQQASLRRPAIWWRGGGVCRPSRDHAATEKLALSFSVRAAHLGEDAKLAPILVAHALDHRRTGFHHLGQCAVSLPTLAPGPQRLRVGIARQAFQGAAARLGVEKRTAIAPVARFASATARRQERRDQLPFSVGYSRKAHS